MKKDDSRLARNIHRTKTQTSSITSSFKLDDNIEPPDPQENCTNILSPNRLARKNRQFPMVVIPLYNNANIRKAGQ